MSILSSSGLQIQISTALITLDRVSFTETNDSVADSADSDQTARMCRLILFPPRITPLYKYSKLVYALLYSETTQGK